MSFDVTIAVVGARGARGPDSATLHADYRVDELHAEIARRSGHAVPVHHGSLGGAPRRGIVLLFCPSLDEALAEAAADVAPRVIWMNAGRTDVRDGLARHGLLGAVERSRYFRWVKARAQDLADGLHARIDQAAALTGAVQKDAGVQGFVLLTDPRYRDLVSLVYALATVASRGPQPAPDGAPGPEAVPEFPIGRLLVAGGDRYRILRALHGTRDRGLYAAKATSTSTSPGADRSERSAYVSLGLRQTVDWDRKRAELELPAAGFAPLLGIARIAHQGSEYDALLEAQPPGVPLPELVPGALPEAQAASVLAPVLDWVAGAHRQGRVVTGLRPELIFAALTPTPAAQQHRPGWGPFLPQPTALLPRCERFLRTAERPCYGFGPPFEQLYQAPELLALREPTPAADVFSLAAILAWMTSGAYPFPGGSLLERMAALMAGAWNRGAASPALVALLARALAPDPAARPDLTTLKAALASLAA